MDTAASAAHLAPWIAKTTESMEISLVRPNFSDAESTEPTTATTFEPNFTYPIYGEQEVVFGYKDLSIQLSYTSGSLRLYPRVDYSAKYQSASGSSSSNSDQVHADDVFGMIKEYLPSDCIGNADEFTRVVLEDAKTFKPIGEKIHEYSREGDQGEDEHFEIYKASFSNPKFREYHQRMQLFVLLYIEGSSYIEDDDEKWEIYTIYRREHTGDSEMYHFVGYATLYPFFYWPENTRMRISQFLVLPPFQKQGHGSELYKTLYQILMTRSEIKEITVEDPNEEFSDMRDKNDFRHLLNDKAFDGLKAPVPKKTIKDLRKKYKLTERQIQRCIEMYLLSKVNKLNREDYKAFRLQVKQRLYLFNLDALQDMEPTEKKEKLHQTYEGVVEDYHRLLEMV
ncbi:histone acetyltransferase type b catalyticsubunit [Lichtheimia corymbifera JMRC:FSU:9682]|uniref:Histone acetyltransferase type B catalytic subunit n=1 Tax=Lichtheimia corymbifera JMRC:FSU:9682 TaxID=1263082 RepID=A0A068RFZ7_9FUNG|nr:histone acetyltransferase type b catalyticsubunit [Lichtheimia corymbifera JMRC:FSU:9682]